MFKKYIGEQKNDLKSVPDANKNKSDRGDLRRKDTSISRKKAISRGGSWGIQPSPRGHTRAIVRAMETGTRTCAHE